MDRAVYAIDQFVGNLKKLLVDIGGNEKSIIVFCSDNGLFLGEHGLGGKSMLYEESVYVPILVYSHFFSKEIKGKMVNEFVLG
ncbi:sulfatase-like hydrolase/transferase [Formosa sp. PL04]|uniref:sulfatase-like hydrolase/transferase n=1 Tax=Formosa sp. PL04 TaxID=3081755 RepID=UPI0029816915|nr:sulfatase-like hydrolase/transferase [Formosa sp. PL04]MDW5290143.1 sulfatase-like hydrolase/transferase [Formosa sp. PL04]